MRYGIRTKEGEWLKDLSGNRIEFESQSRAAMFLFAGERAEPITD